MEKSENNLVRWIGDWRRQTARPLRDDPLLVDIGDDMAMFRPNEQGILVAADMLMDGVDFDSNVHTPEQIGRKALAVNLSDCAAMAVNPRYALVSVALPEAWTMAQAHGLYRGMESLAARYDVRVIGGDTNSWSKPLVIDVTILAEPWPDVRPVTRSGARPGDVVVVSGLLGGSIAGHHIDFEPRVHEARWLADRLGEGLHAMMDLSDGLSTDAARLCAASKVGIELDEPSLLLTASPSARSAAGGDAVAIRSRILNDGEDFELLFAVDPARWRAVRPASGGEDLVVGDGVLKCRDVGIVTDGEGLWLRTATGREPLVSAGWQHFQ